MKPLVSYGIGEYVYVRREQRGGELPLWHLAMVFSRRVWQEPIGQSRSSALAGGCDEFGPLQVELLAVEAIDEGLFAHGAKIVVRSAEDIRLRAEVGSWDRLIRRHL